MQYVTELVGLEELGLFFTDISDQGAAHLKRPQNIQKLGISGTKITDVSCRTLVRYMIQPRNKRVKMRSNGS